MSSDDLVRRRARQLAAQAMMPWPLTRRELEAMAGSTLTARSIEKFLDGEDPPRLRWRAEFTRGGQRERISI